MKPITKARICLYLLRMVMLSGAVRAGAQARLESLTVADGLTQGYVTSMIQDHQGFLWMGTFDGLNRYDGYGIRRFTSTPFDPWSFQCSYITRLYEDTRELIWMGTHEGLYVFDPLKERFYGFSPQAHGLPANHVQEITGDRWGNVFVRISQTDDSVGLYRITLPDVFVHQLRTASAPLSGVVVERMGLSEPIRQPLRLLECIGDTLLLAHDGAGRFFRYEYGARQFQPFDLRRIPAANDFEHNVLWWKGGGYIFRRRTPDGRDVLLPLHCWYKTVRLKEGGIAIWLPEVGGLYKKNDLSQIRSDMSRPPDTLVTQQDFLNEFSVLMRGGNTWSHLVLADRSGILWLGTGGYGLRKYNPRQISFAAYLVNHSISSIRELPDGRLWVRLYTDESFLFNPRTSEREPFPWQIKGLHEWQYEMLADSRGNFWMITPGRYDDRTHRLGVVGAAGQKKIFDEILPFQEAVPEKMLEDRDGNVWIAGHEGLLYRCRPGRFELETFQYASLIGSPYNLRTTTLIQDPEGTLWAGTNRGLLRIGDPNGPAPVFRFFRHDPGDRKSLSIDWVTSICPDPEQAGVFWLGTRGGGLNRLNTADFTFSHIAGAANGLPDNVVYGILADESGHLWCSTNRGLCRFHPGSNTFFTYQENDGLLNTEFNTGAFLRTRDGRFWFGGVNGLNAFRPADIRSSLRQPAVAITAIKARGMSCVPDENGSLSLPYADNNVLFEFAVLDFSNPAFNRFRYRLRGLQRDWVYSGTVHTANFAALPPGRYVFELQGATAESAWNEDSVLFQLTIRPPWYRSWWAYGAYLLLFLLGLTAYIRYRVNLLKLRHTADANQRESERLKAFDSVKNQFFTNIAHELRTPLTIILGLANRLHRGEQDDSVEESADQIILHGNQLLQLTEQVLDLAKMESHQLPLHLVHANICAFINQQASALRPLARSKNIRFVVAHDTPDVSMDFDPAQLQKILNNLIANAIRHTPPNGEIRIRTSLAADRLSVQVSDTGEGIGPDELPHIFERFYQSRQTGSQVGASGLGLTHSRELAQWMGGDLTADSVPGEGAVFTLYLPVTRKAPEKQDLPRAAAVALPAAKSPAGRPVLLLIEDNESVADFLYRCLHPHFHLLLAADGDTGVQKALDAVPDLILTDVAMPGRDGFEVTSLLKNDERTSHIPIVMLTARAEVNERLEGHRRGANAYLTKPFDDRELLLVLRNLLDLRQQWQARYAAPGLTAVLPPPTGGQVPEELEMEDQFIRKLYQIFEQHYADETFQHEHLCRLAGMSRSQLDRKLKALTDQSPMEMLRNFRLQKAYDLLQNNPSLHINEVCYRTGFKSPSHFSRLFSKAFGKPPSAV